MTARRLLAWLALLSLPSCGRVARAPEGVETPGVVALNPNPKQRVDVLFLVDNSSAMDEMQQALRDGFGAFFEPFAALAGGGQFVDFQIGVITSDYGAGHAGAPGCSPATQAGGGGDHGVLQALGRHAITECRGPVGARYLHYSNRPGADNNLPAGQDVVATFGCMAQVGSLGCGFEQPLESLYAALHNHRENAGFVRPDAALAVALLTNEDDASAPPDTDVFDPDRAAAYGYEDSYSRQTRLAILCCPPGRKVCRPDDLAFPPYGDSQGPLTACRGAPNPPGLQYDIQRYIDYFSLPARLGGLKDNPLDVLLFALSAPDDPFEVILSAPSGLAAQPACAHIDEAAHPPCVPVLRHACVNPQKPGRFGDPAVRLNTVVRSVALHGVASVCAADYAASLRALGGLVVSQLGAACLPDEPFAGLPLDRITCFAADVATGAGATAAAAGDIPACGGAAGAPCWRLEPKAACAGSFQRGVGLTIDRGGRSPPPGTYVRAGCLPLPGGR